MSSVHTARTNAGARAPSSASPAARTSGVMDATSTTICSAKAVASDLGTSGAVGSRLTRAMARARSVRSADVVVATAPISSSHAVKAAGASSRAITMRSYCPSDASSEPVQDGRRTIAVMPATCVCCATSVDWWVRLRSHPDMPICHDCLGGLIGQRNGQLQLMTGSWLVTGFEPIFKVTDVARSAAWYDRAGFETSLP